MIRKLNLGRKNVVPGGFKQTLTMVKYTSLDYLRSRKFFILLIIAVLVGVILTSVVGYFRPSSFLSSPLSFYSSWWGMSATFIIILSAIFFGGDAISGEFQNKTGYFIVGNPIRRASIYVGKFLAAFLFSLLILLVFTAITVGNGIYYFGTAWLPYQFVESLLLSILYISAAMGLTFFFSSLFKSSTVSIIVTVILLLFVFSLLQTLIGTLAHVQPWFILTYGAQVISNVLLNPYPPAVVTLPVSPHPSFSISGYYVRLNEGIFIMLGYFIISTVSGLILFEKKEFN
ncbi:ABC transporter permease subunit [Candidatus Parvarchaeota archaeon]|nr:ABC transporter permease subunit [Candidatus Parvarchaeota archaeon]